MPNGQCNVLVERVYRYHLHIAAFTPEQNLGSTVQDSDGGILGAFPDTDLSAEVPYMQPPVKLITDYLKHYYAE